MDKSEEEKIQLELPLEVADSDKKISEERCEQGHKNFSYYNCLPHVVLRNIFQYLNGMDLSSAAMVCRNWRDIADEEKRLRGPYFFTEPIFFDSKEKLNFDCIKKSPVKPFIGFFFLSRNLINYNYVKDRICKLLPANCKTIILFTYGCIINNEIIDDAYSLYFNMSYALLPQNPNIQLNIILISKEDEDYTEYIQMIEELSQQDGSHGCLMIFCQTKCNRCHCSMIKSAATKFGERFSLFSLFSGKVNMVQTNTEKDEPYCIALLITGSIQTWSFIVPETLTLESFKEKLKIFKEQVILQKHSVGFVFSLYVEPADIQEELMIFKEVFPEVSLLGCLNVSITHAIDTFTYKTEFMMRHDNFDARSIVLIILTYD